MISKAIYLSLIVILPLAAAHAAAPEISIRPEARTLAINPPVSINSDASELTAPSQSLRPSKRLKRLFARSTKKGLLCGVEGIEGSKVARVPGRIKGCGVPEPVRVTAVNGVALSQPSIMDCTTAKALHSWVNNSVQPTVGGTGGGVKGLKIAAHYACRTRNNRKGARISEHGKGRAIDISAIQLNDGSSLTVLKDWRSRNSKIMRKLHKDACGPFGTVLGPKADRFHQDHFHFDTARYRSGPYCR